MPEDQPQILPGTAQNHVNSISFTPFEVVAVQQAITFHVPDHRFNGIAPFQLFSDTARDTTLLSRFEDLNTADTVTAITQIHKTPLGTLPGQLLDLP